MTMTLDLGPTFVVAHLLTGSLEEAERATITAIDSLPPGAVTERSLFQAVLETAARSQLSESSASESEAHLPVELRAVLQLPPQPRRCFVLRMLAGLSRQACERMLSLSSEQVNAYVCAALEHLGEASARAMDAVAVCQS